MTNKKYLYLDLLREYHLKLKPVIESKANSSDVYNKTDVYNKSEVDAALDSKSDVGHTHDQYLTEQNVYTKEQVDLALESKSDISHTHDQYLTDIGIDISFDGSDTLKGTATDYKILGVDSTKTYYLSGTKFIGTGCTNITIAPIIGTSATCTYDEETGIVSWTIYGTSSSGPVSANLSWTGAPGILTSTKDGIKTTVGYFNTINGESVVSKTESKNFDIYTKSQVDNKLNAKADASNVYSKSEVNTKLNAKANVSDVYTTSDVDVKINGINLKLNAKANASDVYTSTQVDNKLNEKANASDVYTSTTIDAKLNLKANSSDVYTRDQMDTALNLKANASDVYTTTQVDNKLSGKSPVGHTHDSILDYGDTSKTIKIGYSGAGLTASQIGYIAGYTNGANANEHKIKDISKDVLKSWLGYTEVSSGIISYGGTLTATSGYVWIVYPYDYSANTFTFTYGSGERTGYGFAIVQGEGCIRYFSSTTQLTRYSISRVTFSKQMVYIKFKIG